MPVSGTQNVCQYWRTDEPAVCGNWDISIPACTESDADFYPYCNLLGTISECNLYDGSGTQAMCVRPDSTRTVVKNRMTGNSWIKLPTWSGGGISEAGNFDAISEYNEGKCDTHGTASRCTGYAPYILGFSALQPDDKYGSYGIDKITTSSGGKSTTFSGCTLRLPLEFEIYNRRAWLGRCLWWESDPQDFTVPITVSGATVSGTDPATIVSGVLFLCTNPDEIVKEYKDFKWDPKLGMYRPPCNGAKPECPRYCSNVCWQYCVDKKMQAGDKVLAEQILELRYNIRRERWDADKYKEVFKYPDIQTWEGTFQHGSDSSGTTHALIPSQRVYISDFENFTIESNRATLTAGTRSEDGREQYPTLVEELKNIILSPIIKNVFETISETENIFEVADLNHDTVPIFGDVFYYGADTYGINLKDPDLKLSSQVVDVFRNYDSMEDAKSGLPESFDDIYQDLECSLDFLLRAMPDKMVVSSLGKKNNFFYINMPTFFGDNEIVVLNKGSGRWEFDKISFKKIFCGGIIGQTSFSLVGRGEVNYLPDYANDFGAYINNNGTIDFTFFPLVSNRTGNTSTVSYVYNDSVRKKLPLNPALPSDHNVYDMSYKLYKSNIGSITLTMENMRFFGNAGYVLVTIPDEDKMFTRAIKPWEVGEDSHDIYLTYSAEETSQGNQSTRSTKILMEIFDEDNNHLEPNQIILKPKHISDFRPPCSGTSITLDDVYIYEKRSFGEEPEFGSYEVISDSFIADDDIVIYRDEKIDSIGNNSYKLSKFGFEAMTIGAVFKGFTGREKGQTKTKMITWVRQPYCRDVEIFYGWKAGYTHYTLLPEYWCFGPTGVKVDVETHYQSYTPLCGDHDLSLFTQIGPMWYPYTACDSSANYNIVSTLTEFDTSVMEVFKEDYPADPPHGSHDMRMLGPADNFGFTCDNHASIWNCHCDWSFCNLKKKTENMFAGYGRYRGGLSVIDRLKCAGEAGIPPKFGNTHRDFLRSYRSMDNIDYYYWNGNQYTRKRKWVPMTEFYTSADISLSAQDFPYLLYCSSDYYDDGASFIHPMGLMFSLGSIEGVDIGEKIDIDSDGVPVRYHFEDVFRTHSSSAGIYYPYPKRVYYKNVGGVPTPIISWYTYKDYPGSATGDVSIQWAWQEKWKKIEREVADFEDLNCENYHNTEAARCPHSNIFGKDCLFSFPYTADECGNIPIGRHLFCSIEYPEYKYDYLLGEHRLVADEGEYEIIITPPTFFSDHDEFFWAQIGENGPYRAFDLDGNWDPSGSDQVGPNGASENKYYDLYTTCTDSANDWVDDITLFAPGYTNKSKTTAETEGRMILTTDENGDDIKTYYQRGLKLNLNGDMDFLAKKETLLPLEAYDIKFFLAPTFKPGSSDFGDIIPGDPYPGQRALDVAYVMSSGTSSGTNPEFNVSLEFAIRPSFESEDGGPGIISRVDCEFEYGTSSEDDNNYYYYVPDVSILVDNVEKYICSSSGVTRASGAIQTSRCSYSWQASSKDLLNFKKNEMNHSADDSSTISNVKITFKLPSIKKDRNNTNTQSSNTVNIISIKNIYLYHSNFVKSKEKIKVYERKYNISYGHHGDFPPHGRDATGSLLYPLSSDKSSVYQYDTLNGVVGLPNSSGDLETMNKVRGRILKKCHADKEPIEGPKNLSRWEEKQKKIYDAIAIDSGKTEFTLTASAPPAMQKWLNEIGLSFPSWNCTFKNTMVRPLKQVDQYPTYSPCGHRFRQDFKHMKKKVCFVHKILDTFEYVYESACPKYSGFLPIGQVDVLVAYYQGTGRVLTHPMEYMEGINREYEEVSQRATSGQGSILMTFPGEVNSL